MSKKKQQLGAAFNRAANVRPVAVATAHPSQMRQTQMVLLKALVVNPDIQVRAEGTSASYVEELAAILRGGGEFDDPIVVFFDGDTYWLADGHHRAAAYHQEGYEEVRVEVREGGLRDAMLFAERVNLSHGWRYSSKTKRKIFQRWIEQGRDGFRWSENTETLFVLSTLGVFAKELGVSDRTISNWFKTIIDDLMTTKIFVVDQSQAVGLDGRVIDTENIRAKEKPKKQAKPFTPKSAYVAFEKIRDRNGVEALTRLDRERRREIAEQFRAWANQLEIED